MRTWSDRRTALVVGVVVAGVVALGAGAQSARQTRTTGDEPHYLLTALSLAEDGDLDVSDERARLAYLPFHDVALSLQADIQADGRQVEPHDPLLPALLALPMALGGWLAAKLAMAAVAGGVAAATVWAARRRFGVGRRTAVAVAVAAGCSPPLAVYGTQIYPEIVAALACLVGFLAVTAARPSGRTTLLSVVAVVALPWLSVKYVPVAAVLAALLVAQLWFGDRRRLLVPALGGLVLAAMTYLAGHQVLYGGWTVYAAGSHFEAGELTVAGRDPDLLGRSVRLVGLLIDRHFGLGAWQPAWLLAPVGLVHVLRHRSSVSERTLAIRRPTNGEVLVAVVTAGWLTATFVALTMHGWWWPGRQVVVVLPLVAVAGAAWLDRAPAKVRIGVAAAGALGLWAWVTVVVGASTGDHSLVTQLGAIHWLPQWVLDPLLPDLRADGWATDARVAAWAVSLVVVAGGAGTAARHRIQP